MGLSRGTDEIDKLQAGGEITGVIGGSDVLPMVLQPSCAL